MTDTVYVAQCVMTLGSVLFFMNWLMVITFSELPAFIREALKIGSVAHLGTEKQASIIQSFISMNCLGNVFIMICIIYTSWAFNSANDLWLMTPAVVLIALSWIVYLMKIDSVNGAYMLSAMWSPLIIAWCLAWLSLVYFQEEYPMMNATVDLFGSEVSTWLIFVVACFLLFWPIVIRPNQFLDIKCGDENKEAGKADPLMMGMRNRKTVVANY